NVQAYAEAKARITMNQTADDTLVLNQDDPRTRAIAHASNARVVSFSATGAGDASLDDGRLTWRGEAVLDRGEVALPGRAGAEDALAALACAASYGIELSTIADALRGFRGLRHRLETVGSYDGVTYIDDSKATNPHATLSAVAELRDVVLIAGGRSKGIDLSPLRASVPPVIGVVAIGEAAREVAAVFSGLVPVDIAADMDSAVAAAHARSVPGGSVLLSPACASLDMYESYAERGEDFARAVSTTLKKEGTGGDA
ncbi:MAG TPA: UDP-N-acetylmuramoyl-L-alanine--D-glutamate ligase, partial [Actinomycetota bacterium]|nr:UDP-N-acetylmuramoyl-L-alanine--D-glutamate ligase [Actinomycetota bacterium]